MGGVFARLLPDAAAAVHLSESVKVKEMYISTGNWAIKNILKGFSVGTAGDKHGNSGNNIPRC